MALSHILPMMTSQGPAARKAGKRDRCAPLEAGFTIRQTPLSPLFVVLESTRLQQFAPP